MQGLVSKSGCCYHRQNQGDCAYVCFLLSLKLLHTIFQVLNYYLPTGTCIIILVIMCLSGWNVCYSVIIRCAQYFVFIYLYSRIPINSPDKTLTQFYFMFKCIKSYIWIYTIMFEVYDCTVGVGGHSILWWLAVAHHIITLTIRGIIFHGIYTTLLSVGWPTVIKSTGHKKNLSKYIHDITDHNTVEYFV